MKKKYKRMLATALCVAMAMSCCPAVGFSATAATEAVDGEWVLLENIGPATLNRKMDLKKQRMGLQLPFEGLTLNDYVLFVDITVDEVGAAWFNISSNFELDNYNDCDCDELQLPFAPEDGWVEGRNTFVIPFLASSSDPSCDDWKNKTGKYADVETAGQPFSLEKAINYMRWHTGGKEPEGNANFTIHKIAIRFAEGGVTFPVYDTYTEKDTDTYLVTQNPLSATPQTVEATVKMAAAGEAIAPVGDATVGDVNVNGGRVIVSDFSGGTGNFAFFIAADGRPTLVYGNRQITFAYNAAHGEHVSLSVVREGSKFTLYVNGDKWQSSPAVTATASVNTSVSVAAHKDGTGLFAGVLGDVRLWSDARTATEIKNNQVDLTRGAPGDFDEQTAGLMSAWFLRGNATRVLESFADSAKRNPLLFAGSRRDHWYTHDQLFSDVDWIQNGDYYTMVMIPDPQNITVPARREVFESDMQWIADNIETENIVHVTELGDTTWVNNVPVWEYAQKVFKNTFADKVTWNVVAGNHDYDGHTSGKVTRRDTTNYNAAFGLDFIRTTKAADAFVDYYRPLTAEYDIGYTGTENSYYVFDVGNVHWMILQLELQPRRSVLQWASDVLDRYPDHNVIITTHNNLSNSGSYSGVQSAYKFLGAEGFDSSANPSGMTSAGLDYSGSTQALYNTLSKTHDNVKMVISGHTHNNGDGMSGILTRNEDRNGDGTVDLYQMMINAQNLDANNSGTSGYYTDRGVGLLGLLRFKKDGSAVSVSYYCSSDDMYYDPNHESEQTKPQATATGSYKTGASTFVLPLDLITFDTESEFALTSATASVCDKFAMTFEIDAETVTKIEQQNALSGDIAYKAQVWFGDEAMILENEATDGAVRFTVPDILPNEIDKVATIRPYAECGENTVWGEIQSLSIGEYCYELMAQCADENSDAYVSDEAERAEVQQLCVAMLNFGSAAQNYKDLFAEQTKIINTLGENLQSSDSVEARVEAIKNTMKTRLVNNVLTDEQKTVKPILKKREKALNGETAQWVKGAVVLTDTLTLRVKFTTAADVTGWTVEASAGEVSAIQTDESGLYYVDVTGLGMTRMREDITFTIKDADGALLDSTLTYSVEAYARAQKGLFSGAGELIQAMVAYGDAVAAYLAE